MNAKWPKCFELVFYLSLSSSRLPYLSQDNTIQSMLH